MITLNNGTKIAEIGFGSYKVTDDLTGGKSRQVVLDALEVGYRYIDTAAFYGNEKEIGDALKMSGLARRDVFLATKVWKTELGFEKTEKAIQASLEKLQSDYIDLFLIHWPKETPEDQSWKEKIQGSYAAMEEAYGKGLILNLGLSNFLPHHIIALNETAKVKPVLDQLELHAGHIQYAAVTYLQQINILPQAWSPLGRARVFKHPAIVAMAEKYGVTVSDLLLRFLLQQGFSVIPKATSRAHMEGNLHPKAFTLSESDLWFLKCLPSIGWAGEHPDFEREAVDNRYTEE